MTQDKRESLRAKQDRLVELAAERGFHPDLQISNVYAGSPTVRDLMTYLQPEWEPVIDTQIRWLENHSQ